MTFDGVDLYPTVVEKAAVLLRGVIAANSFLDGNKRTAWIAVMRAGRMITQAHGNLLEADVDALVNTVNTVGIMGKGIALQSSVPTPRCSRVTRVRPRATMYRWAACTCGRPGR